MSARQAFIPRAPSCAPSFESHPHPDARVKDVGQDGLTNGSGKARSISAFLGQKRGITVNTGSGPTKGPGLGRSNSSTSGPSFDGILRPELTPMSIIPFPGAGVKQPALGQTQRKAVCPDTSDFSRPLTPLSVPRGLKKVLGAFTTDAQEEEAILNRRAHGSNVLLSASGGEVNMHVSAGAGGGYMRIPEEFGGGGGAGLDHDIVAPMPGYAPGRLDANLGEEHSKIDGMELEQINRFQRSIGGGTKRMMYQEAMDGVGDYTGDDHRSQGSAKRAKRGPQDTDEYLPISSPHVPPTPVLPAMAMSGNVFDPSLIASSLFDNFEEFISLEEMEADWKRWEGCTTEEWLKDGDQIVEEFAGVMSMVKDHLTAKVMAFANMISSVEEKRSEVDRNIELIQGKGDVVRENISKLGRKK